MNFEQRDILFHSMKSKHGMRSKVNAKCFDCIYDESAPGTWRIQVENCSVKTCALYEIRPTSYRDDSLKLLAYQPDE